MRFLVEYDGVLNIEAIDINHKFDVYDPWAGQVAVEQEVLLAVLGDVPQIQKPDIVWPLKGLVSAVFYFAGTERSFHAWFCGSSDFVHESKSS